MSIYVCQSHNHVGAVQCPTCVHNEGSHGSHGSHSDVRFKSARPPSSLVVDAERRHDILTKPDTTNGLKLDTGKARFDLVCPLALEEMAKVLDFGSRKYAAFNWAKGIAYSRVLAAILRHTFAYLRGQTLDPETGLSHMAAVMCNAMFLLHFEKMKPEFDDRPKDVYKA